MKHDCLASGALALVVVATWTYASVEVSLSETFANSQDTQASCELSFHLSLYPSKNQNFFSH